MKMRILFIAIAVVLFGVAIYFGNQQPSFASSTGAGVTPNMVAGLAAFGFALAGGLSLIAAAIAKEPNWAGGTTMPSRQVPSEMPRAV
jgi:hypothetical protein